jgi:hypothetical protein
MPFLNSKLGIDFSNYVTDRTENFTGREWVFEAIQNWLADTKGYRFFLLTGEPGSGKTAIAARLTQFAQGAKTYPGFEAGFLQAVHFCSARDSIWTDPKEFARSLALQLAQSIPEFGLALKDIGEKSNNISVVQTVGTVQSSSVQGVVIQNLTISGLTGQEAFTQVVVNPLRQIQGEGFNQPAILLVDGLDEALTHDGESNIVNLLSRLSDDVKLRAILTSRNEDRVTVKLNDCKELFLSETKNLQENQRDLRAYINTQFKQEEVLQNCLQAESLDQEILTTKLIDKSERCNFLYVRFLLKSVALGQRSLANLEGLPQDLDELYYDSLGRVVELGKKNWSEVYAPIIGMLLAAQESLTESQIRAFTKLKESVVWDCLNDLQQLLDEVESKDEETRYRLYHQSVADFLGKRQLLIRKKKSKNRYYLPETEQHQRIVEYYHPNNQPWSKVKLEQQIDSYGRSHLAQHLVKGDRVEELHTLLALEKDEKNAWFKVKDAEGDTAGFLADVELAWSQADAVFDREPTKFIELQCRYALIISSVNSLASNIPPVLLEELVKQEIWSLSKAISYTRQIPDGEHRVKSLARLLPYLQKADREQCFMEGLSTSQSIREQRQIELLQVLIEHLPDPKPKPLMEAVLRQIWKFTDSRSRMEALNNIAPYLSQDLATEAYSKSINAKDIRVDGERMWRVITLAQLSPKLNEHHRHQAIEFMRADTDKITEDGSARAIALESMMNLDDLRTESAQLLTTALESVRFRSLSDWMKPRAMLKLFPHVSHTERSKFLDEMLQSLKELSPEDQLELLSQIAAQVALLSLQKELLLAVKKYLGSDEPLLQRDLLSSWEADAWYFQCYNYVLMLAVLAPHMPREQQSAIIQESIYLADNILSKMRSTFSEGELLSALAKLTPYMEVSQVMRLYPKIRRIRSPGWRLQSLSYLVSSLPKEECEKLIRELLTSIQVIKNEPSLKIHLKISWENIVPCCSASLLQEALTVSQVIHDNKERIRNLSYFVPFLSDSQKLVAFRWILSLASGEDEEWWRATLLSESAPHLPIVFGDEALTLARALTQPMYRAKAMTALALVLTSEKQQILAEVRAAIEQIDNTSALCQARIDLLPLLSARERKVLITSIRVETDKLEDMNLQVSVWVQLLPFLSKSKRADLLKSAVGSVKISRHEDRALKILAPHLPVKLVKETLDSRLYLWSTIAESIPALLARLTELGQPHVALRYIYIHRKEPRERYIHFLSIIPHLSLSSILKACPEVLLLEVRNNDSVLEALCLRLTKLNQVKLAQTALLWRISRNSQARVNTLIGMAPYLDMNEQAEMLQEVLSIVNENNSVEWTNLAPYLARCNPAILTNFWKKALHLLSAKNRQQFIPSLYSLAPIIIALGTTETLISIFSDIEDVVRWWP